MLNVTVLQLLLIFIHLTGNFIITLSPLVILPNVLIAHVNTHQLCFISAVSTPLVFNNTALYQKKSSKAPSPAVSQAASSEYVHQEDISDFSVRVIVKVLGLYGGRTFVSHR
jgi:hypothetical protein